MASRAGLVESPKELRLRDGEQLVVTFVVYSQYNGFRELESGETNSKSPAQWPQWTGCTSVWSKDTTYNNTLKKGTVYDEGNKALMMQQVSVFTRGAVNTPKTPHAQDTATTTRPEQGIAKDYEPVLYGHDGAWLNKTVLPFLDLPCDAAAAKYSGYSGWDGGKGVVSFKRMFEQSILGYLTCGSTTVMDDIEGHPSAALYLLGIGSNNKPKPISTEHKKRALHLLRRSHACHRGVAEAMHWPAKGTAGGGAQVTRACQFTLPDTVRLRNAVIHREMGEDWGYQLAQEAVKYGTKQGVWWWEHTWQRAGGFDLATAGTVAYFTLFVDTLRPYLPEENITAIEGQMTPRIDQFLRIFQAGEWPLWNGNNWTPILCLGVVHWAIHYWHRDSTRAKHTLDAVYDILWLHREMYSDARLHSAHAIDPATAYAEGVSYSELSSRSLFAMADLMWPAFGEVPPAIATLEARLTSMPTWLLWNMATDGSLVPFGDSHRKMGWVGQPTLRSMMAAEVLHTIPGTSTGQGRSVAMEMSLARTRPCEIRSWFMAAYFQGVGDPWRFPPELAKNWSAIIAGCGGAGGVASRQLGGGDQVVYPGYAAMRSPLLPVNTSALQGADGVVCFQDSDRRHGGTDGFGCITASVEGVSFAGSTVYSFLSVQARDSSIPHTEMDFGTMVWTAWGVRFMSEHGYGTIADNPMTGIGDTRRIGAADNNPAGHNTLIIRQANPYFVSTGTPAKSLPWWGTTKEQTFSQFSGVRGTVALMPKVKVTGLHVGDSKATEGTKGTNVTGTGDRPCVEVDGGAVYGANRAYGWLDAFRRYACPLAHGHYLVVDTFSTKANRSPLVLHGSYNGPSFDETKGGTRQAFTSLDIDSYFHTDVESGFVDAQSLADKPFDRSTLPAHKQKICAHVDVKAATSGTSTAGETDVVHLRPRCGAGYFRQPDGVGSIAGWSLNGGSFAYDGAVTAVNNGGDKTYLRRFRWQGGNPVTSHGDVRAFVLATAPASGTKLAQKLRALATPTADAPNSTGVVYPMAWARRCPGDAPHSPCSTKGTAVCVCVETCAAGSVYWATAEGGAALDAKGGVTRGADRKLTAIVFAGTCNATHVVQYTYTPPATTTAAAAATTATMDQTTAGSSQASTLTQGAAAPKGAGSTQLGATGPGVYISSTGGHTLLEDTSAASHTVSSTVPDMAGPAKPSSGNSGGVRTTTSGAGDAAAAASDSGSSTTMVIAVALCVAAAIVFAAALAWKRTRDTKFQGAAENNASAPVPVVNTISTIEMAPYSQPNSFSSQL